MSAERQVQLETAWWAWHDADSSRWSADAETAEERCAAWVAGESDDGPPPGDPSDDDEQARLHRLGFVRAEEP